MNARPVTGMARQVGGHFGRQDRRRGPAAQPLTPPGIRLRGLALHYRGATVFSGLSAELLAGSCTALLGPSGVGKTSLLRIVAGLEAPAEGRVDTSDHAPLAGRIAMMAQTDGLCPWLSAQANVWLGARLRGRPSVADRARARHLLDQVGLAHRAEARPAELSGGQRQRVALARTLFEDRPVVLMDEPFSALDALTRARVQDLAATLLRGRTTLLITHDPLEAARMGDQLLVLSGAPAMLASPLRPTGPTPRPPDDPDVLASQARLLRLLLA